MALSDSRCLYSIADSAFYRFSDSIRTAPSLVKGDVPIDARITTGVKLRGPEGAQRLRATSASTSELYGMLPAGRVAEGPTHRE
jgi:hypothetical protein